MVLRAHSGFLFLLLAFFTCVRSSPGAEHGVALREVFADDFRIGVALHRGQFSNPEHEHRELIETQFNSITPENALKWQRVHRRPGDYDFTVADRFVEFGERHGMFIVGHTLVWHSQVPDWVFEDAAGEPLSREALLERMRDHIFHVVGRYKGRIGGWDVVNEALNDDGTLRKSPWLRIIGEDYIAKAFQFAAEADPEAELYYNDYSLANPAKRAGAVRLIKQLRSQEIKVTGIGMQGHFSLAWPRAEQIDETIATFADLGVKVMITELDIDVLPRATNSDGADIALRANANPRLNPYAEGLPADVSRRLAERYGEIFRIFGKHREAITRVTFWGVTDGDSWLNNWPVRGRVSYPLLFDRNGQPKPAFDAVVKSAAATGDQP